MNALVPSCSLRLFHLFTVLITMSVPLFGQESRPSPGRVWVLAGQSNMEGNGYLDAAAADPRVLILRKKETGSAWEEGREPSHRGI